MKKTTDLDTQLKQLKPLLKTKFHVKKIGYFGSFANKTFDADSDIDILVEFSKPIGWEFIDLKSFLEGKLNRTVDLVTKNALKEQTKKSILNQVKYL